MRNELRPKLFTGHFHISKIQGKGLDLNPIEIKTVVNVVKQTLLEGIKGIQL